MIIFKSKIVLDDYADLSWLDQTDDDMGEGFEQSAKERIDAYIHGDWSMTGVIVSAIWEQPGYVPHEVAQESLWGIESDSGDAYYQEVIADLTAKLKSRLPELVKAIQELHMD